MTNQSREASASGVGAAKRKRAEARGIRDRGSGITVAKRKRADNHQSREALASGSDEATRRRSDGGSQDPTLSPAELRELVGYTDDLIRDLRHEITSLRGERAGLKAALRRHQERIDELLSALAAINGRANGTFGPAAAHRVREIAICAMTGARIPEAEPLTAES